MLSSEHLMRDWAQLQTRIMYLTPLLESHGNKNYLIQQKSNMRNIYMPYPITTRLRAV